MPFIDTMRRGARLTASWLNTLGRKVPTVYASGKGVNVSRIGNGLNVAADIPETARNFRARVARFRVKEEGDDWLRCVLYNAIADIEGAEIYVAKPYTLRKTPFDGETVTYFNGNAITYTYSADSVREATNGTDTETQVLTPAYYEDEQILAASDVLGSIGVDHPVLANVKLQWEEINTTGRMWAVEYEEDA